MKKNIYCIVIPQKERYSYSLYIYNIVYEFAIIFTVEQITIYSVQRMYVYGWHIHNIITSCPVTTAESNSRSARTVRLESRSLTSDNNESNNSPRD